MSDMYDLTMNSITGESVSLANFRGKVCLLVNVATN
jgi:glutathione peroxidase-family protein